MSLIEYKIKTIFMQLQTGSHKQEKIKMNIASPTEFGNT
jgi:hypothetical protein